MNTLMNPLVSTDYPQLINRSAHNSNWHTRFWEVGEYSELYRGLICFLTKVLETETTPFDVIRQSQRVSRHGRVGGEGDVLASAMGQCRYFMDLYEPGWSYTADLQLFFDCYQKHPFGLVEPGMSALDRFNDHVLVDDVYNDFIAFLRTEAVRLRVKKWLADWKAGLIRQSAAIQKNLNGLYAQYGSMLVVRIDHFYSVDALDERDLLPRMSWQPRPSRQWSRVRSRAPSPTGMGETRARIDTGMAMGHRASFFKNQYGADRWLFEHMVGSIWKMEVGGRSNANHFHGLYLFDGRHRKVSDLARLIDGLTNRWWSVTGGLGSSYNCHESSGRQYMIANGTWALGMHDCQSQTHRNRLDNYVRYFAKTDFERDDAQAVRIKPTDRANTLTMMHGRRQTRPNR